MSCDVPIYTYIKKAVTKLVNKDNPSYVGLKEEHIAQAVWSKAGKEISLWESPISLPLSGGQWTLTTHLAACWNAKEVSYCEVQCTVLFYHPQALLHDYSVQAKVYISFPTSHPPRLWHGDNWLRSGHVMKESSKGSKIFLTSYRGICKTFLKWIYCQSCLFEVPSHISSCIELLLVLEPLTAL